MNNHEKEKGRAPITPSARRSIHSHGHCIFPEFSDRMGRYGLAKDDKRKVTPLNQGIDEVDNVLSKCAYPSSPLQDIRKGDKRLCRRNSLITPANTYTDESDSNFLSKSLPATLTSNYYSDEYVHQSLPSDFYKTHITTNENQENIANDSHGLFHSETEFQQEGENPHSSKNKVKQLLLPILCIFTLLVAICFKGIIDLDLRINNSKSIIYDESRFNKEIVEIGERYKIDDHSILEIQTGVSSIYERNDTGAFIFLYNSKYLNFSYERFGNFMEDIATIAARYLRNHSATIQPTVVQSSQLNMKSHRELMTKYRSHIAKSGVMLLKDLDSVPSNLAMAFHYFCDEYNPLEAKTAIFFTLNLAHCFNTSDQKSSYLDVEKCLEKKWSTVPEDNIKPLLARVINVIVDVRGIS